MESLGHFPTMYIIGGFVVFSSTKKNHYILKDCVSALQLKLRRNLEIRVWIHNRFVGRGLIPLDPFVPWLLRK